MRRLVLLVWTAATAATTAHAEPAPSVVERAPTTQLALAFNLPLLWKHSLGASGWIGLNDHHALRLNFARYRGPLWRFLASKYLEDPSDADFGSTTDIGVSWVQFRRRVLDGPTIEAGALCRIHRLRDHIHVETGVANQQRNTNIYGGRVLVGWTWRQNGPLFLSAAVGASMGYERGTERVIISYDPQRMPVDRRVSRLDVAAEGYLRFGTVFGRH